MDRILEQIIRIVEQKHLTHDYLATEMGISRSYVSMLLSGKRVLNKDLLIRFSKALSVPVEELIHTNASGDYLIKTRGEFNSRKAQSKMAQIKIQMDDYIRLKGIYADECLIKK